MNLTLSIRALAGLPLVIALAGCAPSHDTGKPLQQQTPASHVAKELPAAVKNGKKWAKKNNGIVVAAGSLYLASAVLYELGVQV